MIHFLLKIKTHFLKSQKDCTMTQPINKYKFISDKQPSKQK